MNIKEKKSSWMLAIAEGQTERVLEEIGSWLQAWSDDPARAEVKERFQQFALLSGRWKTLQQESSLGVIGAAEEKIERNKITHALITFIDQLPDEWTERDSSVGPVGGFNRRRMGLAAGIGLLAVILALLASNNHRGNDQPPITGATDSLTTQSDTIETEIPVMEEKDTVIFDPASVVYSIPKIFPIDWALVPGICEHELGCLIEEFLPIGWSQDDKYFAYITLPDNEAAGGFALTFRIQNLESNEIEWQDDYGKGETNGYNHNANINTVWKSKEVLFTGKLRRYGIIPSPGKRITFPMRFNGKTYEVRLKTTTKENEYEEELIHTETIYTTVDGQNSEKIFSHTYEKYGPLHAALVGALVSPRKKRAALIKVIERPGWEGPPNILSGMVVGYEMPH